MKPIIKVPLKFGGIGAAILILMFFVFLLTDSNPLLEMKVFDFFILPVFLFFGIKEFRDSFNQGEMTYGQGMTTGLIIYGCIAIGYSIFLAAALQFTSPDLLAEYIAKSVEVFESNKAELTADGSEEMFLQTIKDAKQTQSIDLVWDSLLKKIGIGFLLTSLLATVLKRKTTAE